MHQTIMSTLGTAHGTDPALDHSELERIAMAALEVGRLLMETGARAEIVHEDSSLVAHGLGADHVDVRSGYASLDITVARGASTVTRMTEVGAHGVNYLLGHGALRVAPWLSRHERLGRTPVGPLKPLRLPPPQPWATLGEYCVLARVSPALL